MHVTGVFVAAGPAIHADVVTALAPATRWYDSFPLFGTGETSNPVYHSARH